MLMWQLTRLVTRMLLRVTGMLAPVGRWWPPAVQMLEARQDQGRRLLVLLLLLLLLLQLVVVAQLLQRLLRLWLLPLARLPGTGESALAGVCKCAGVPACLHACVQA